MIGTIRTSPHCAETELREGRITSAPSVDRFQKSVQRYKNGEWRAKVFRDLILDDVHRFQPAPIMLDIGCGAGFDGSTKIQAELAAVSKAYIAVEPDESVQVSGFVDRCHRSFFENADLECHSIDIAFCVMVLEHVSDPRRFWRKLGEVLKPGGVFWGFTVDRRHFFSYVSTLMERLRIKDWFLERLRGRRGFERYQNYNTYYRANTPGQIRKLVPGHFSCDFLSFSKVGQLDYYVPQLLRPVAHVTDRIQMAARLPGSLLAVRLENCVSD